MKKQIITISGPSGVGKNTLLDHLLKTRSDLDFAISATSRDMREGDVEGKTYFFLSPNEFQSKIEAGDFLEYFENYPGKFYGTLWSEIHRIWEEGKSFISDIDVMGALNIKQELGDDVLTIFIVPPSIDELRDRLLSRGTETEGALAPRIARWEMELEKKNEFDIVLVNDDLETAKQNIEKIVEEFLNT
jgi:guanylate kinase